MIGKPTTICYFGIYRPTAPRDRVYLEGLKKRGIQVGECVDSSPGLLKFFRLVKKHRILKGHYDILWVGYLSTMVVPLAWLLRGKFIVFNALDSWYDRAIRDRVMYSRFSPIAWAIWFCDFLAFHLADVVLLESESQKKFIATQFKVESSKLKVIYTGADTDVFFPDPQIKKLQRFTVVFRGMFLPATGVEYVIEAAKLLRHEPIDFIIIGWGPLLEKVKRLISENRMTNITLMSEFLEPKALRELILSCHVMVGQFANHPRMERTIQHKTFEALALGMPYITRDSTSNRELLTDGVNCLFVSPANPQAIAEKIMLLKNHEVLRESLAKNAKVTYAKNCSADVLIVPILKLFESFKI